MPNKEQHIKTALKYGLPILAIGTFFSLNFFMGILNFGISFIFLIIGTIFPDIIEPPNSPFHRGKFHSYVIFAISAAGIGFLILKIVNSGTGPLISAILGFTLGYFIHLSLDSKTRMGLPL